MKTIMNNPILAAALAAIGVVAGGVGTIFVLSLVTNIGFVETISNPVIWVAIALFAVLLSIATFRKDKRVVLR